jgi:hypothetical protein
MRLVLAAKLSNKEATKRCWNSQSQTQSKQTGSQMRKQFSEIKNSKLFTANDPALRAIGNVVDLLIEDGSWNVRYLVITTDAPLSRRVLISPTAIEGFDFESITLATLLTTHQVVQSPTADFDEPISRQYEQALIDYYGWPIYWFGKAGFKPQSIEAFASDKATASVNERDASNLRSANEICGYQIQSQDGPAGVMMDLAIQVESWTVDYATADSASWRPTDSSMFSTSRISCVDWSTQHVMVDL